MKLLKAAFAAALAVSSLGIGGAALAQGVFNPHGNAGEHRGDGRNDHRRGYDNNRGHHYGWNNNRRHKVCKTVWRHHQRQRVCNWVRR